MYYLKNPFIKNIKKKKESPEEDLCLGLARVLKLKYKKVHFEFDKTGRGLSKRSAKNSSECTSRTKDGDIDSFPDLRIYPRGKRPFFMEIKSEHRKIIKKNGDFYPHEKKQFETMQSLTTCGIDCYFAIGFDAAIHIFEHHLEDKPLVKMDGIIVVD